MAGQVKICLIGNCQIAPLRTLFRALNDRVEVSNLPAVHTMSEAHRSTVVKSISEADWVVAQYVSDDYPIDFVRTSVLSTAAAGKLVVWPNLYFAGYAPEYNTLRDSSYQHFSGPLLDYHSDKIIFGFFTGLDVAGTIRLMREPSRLDELWYGSSVSDAFANLRTREKLGHVAIADFVEERFRFDRLFYIMNHPSVIVLLELAYRIFALIGEKHSRDVTCSFFKDIELVSAIHPENSFIRQKFELRFPEIIHYRGVKLVQCDSPLGFKAEGPLIYDEQSMVSAMFEFYSRHTDRLSVHGRVKEVLSRPRG